MRILSIWGDAQLCMLLFTATCCAQPKSAQSTTAQTTPTLSATSQSTPAPFTTIEWASIDVALETSQEYPWWEFPAEATFTHTDTNVALRICAFYNGGRHYIIRFAPTLPGEWRYRIHSADQALSAKSGVVHAATPTPEQIASNPNLRGLVQISKSRRHLEYADGTPFLLLGDTNWSINTARCGLGDDRDGPFFKYLVDRKSKGFTTLLMAYMRGFGDTKEPAGQRNERGYPFCGGDTTALNAAYFQALDTRMQAIWDEGFVVAVHPTWFGKLNCFFDFATAQRISAYLAVRYGACNALWSLSGEYQYAMKDCGWTAAQINQLGAHVQDHNPYRRPLSIHPSGRTNWPIPHGDQSSRAFHDTSWLDMNWLQTGQQSRQLHFAAERSQENYQLSPVKPVLLAEGFYENADDPERVYHARWQAWTAMLNGAAGYGYGCWGLWQFYDPDDPQQETGKQEGAYRPWQEALTYEGSQQIYPLRKLFDRLPWWKLRPCRDGLTVDRAVNLMPTETDISPPHCARADDGTVVVYIPRGNAGRQLALKTDPHDIGTGYWYNPRTAESAFLTDAAGDWTSGKVPARPAPAQEDWVLVLQPTR